MFKPRMKVLEGLTVLAFTLALVCLAIPLRYAYADGESELNIETSTGEDGINDYDIDPGNTGSEVGDAASDVYYMPSDLQLADPGVPDDNMGWDARYDPGALGEGPLAGNNEVSLEKPLDNNAEANITAGDTVGTLPASNSITLQNVATPTAAAAADYLVPGLGTAATVVVPIYNSFSQNNSTDIANSAGGDLDMTGFPGLSEPGLHEYNTKNTKGIMPQIDYKIPLALASIGAVFNALDEGTKPSYDQETNKQLELEMERFNSKINVETNLPIGGNYNLPGFATLHSYGKELEAHGEPERAAVAQKAAADYADHIIDQTEAQRVIDSLKPAMAEIHGGSNNSNELGVWTGKLGAPNADGMIPIEKIKRVE